MNKRKCVKSQLEMQQTNNRQIKNLYNTNGITLIALVISIIVMLILAGVSLNATIGENGIMTQAKNATYMQGIATLEEYLQSEYVKYYDEADNYTNKVELLVNKISNLCLKDGTKNYITYDGKMYYLLNKQALPEEIRNQLRGGDTTDYLSYIRLKDVYGITEDLRVYYCSEGTDNVLGTLNTSELNPNTPLVKVNTDNEIKSAISDALSKVGVEVGENGVTVGDASKIKDLELDGSKYNITSISALSEISTLKTLTLSNLTLDNLDGLENCTLLTGIYFKNCKVNNYTKLSTAWNLQYLYLYLPPTMSETDANAQVEKLGEGLANATEIKNLEYFGISGTTAMFDGKYTSDTSDTSKIYYVDVEKYSNLTNIDNLEKFSNNLKQSIKYLYLNNNSFKSINSLKDFKNLNEADLMCNINLENLDGLENSTNLVYLCAQYCNLKNIVGITGSINLRIATFDSNLNLESLTGLEDSKNLDFLTAWKCNINDVTALKDNMKLRYLNLANNINLQNIIALKNCTGIKKLYLSGNENMIGIEVRDALADETTHILQNCGGNYSIPSKYNIYFTTLTSYDYSNLNLTDDSDEINSLKNKTNVTRLNLSGNSQLSNAKLQEILSTMTGLEYLSLNGCTNLSSIDFVGDKKVTKLVELDVRNTSKSLTDLSNLNNYATDLKTLVINNTSTDMSKIQVTINRISQPYDTNLNGSWIAEKVWQIRGFILDGNYSEYSFSNCNEITTIKMQMLSMKTCSGTLDLTGCSNLKEFVQSYEKGSINVSFPLSIISVSYTGYGSLNFKENTNLEILVIRHVNDEKLSNLPESMNIKELRVNGNEGLNLKNLNSLSEKTSFESLTLTSSKDLGGIFKMSGFEEMSGVFYLKYLNLNYISDLKKEFFEHMPYLQNITITYSTGVTSISGIENCTELTKINISNNSISSIQPLENLEKLKHINITNNKISDISYISNKKDLSELYCSGNNITDVSSLENLIVNGKTKLTSLSLNNNLLQTTTLTGHNNVDTLVKLHDAGLKSLNISGNNFTVGTTDKLKNLSWTSYTE